MSNTKLVKLGKKGQIFIPRALRESMGIEAGDLFLMASPPPFLRSHVKFLPFAVTYM